MKYRRDSNCVTTCVFGEADEVDSIKQLQNRFRRKRFTTNNEMSVVKMMLDISSNVTNTPVLINPQ